MPTTPDFSQQEQHRLLLAAYDLFMARGITPVTPADIALNARLPAAAVARYFPAGKAALVAAVADQYLAAFTQRLADNQQQSSNAVEEMLRLRRALTDTPTESRSPFLRELAATQPALYQPLEATRQAGILAYMRRNLQRGQAEGLYLPALDGEVEAQQWLRLATAALATVADAPALAEVMVGHTNAFLTRVTTPAGAYLVRRLQEAAPYY